MGGELRASNLIWREWFVRSEREEEKLVSRIKREDFNG